MSLWFRSDWINPIGNNYNWIDFTVIHVSGELDNRFGNLEFHVALLGFHVGGTWKVAKGDQKLQSELSQMMEDIKSGEAHISVSIGEWEDLRRRAGDIE